MRTGMCKCPVNPVKITSMVGEMVAQVYNKLLPFYGVSVRGYEQWGVPIPPSMRVLGKAYEGYNLWTVEGEVGKWLKLDNTWGALRYVTKPTKPSSIWAR